MENGKHLQSFYPVWKQFVEVIQIKLLNGIGCTFHFKHVGWVHLALNCCAEVLRKLSAVDGCRHKNDLGKQNNQKQKNMDLDLSCCRRTTEVGFF